ncbi:Sec1-like protein [Phycomyces blakesleeanus]
MMFRDLNQRLKSTGASEYILCLKEMYVDFMVVESAVFTVEPVTSFFSIFGTDPRSHPEDSIRVTAKQLLSVCATLGEDPIIRYQTPPPPPPPPSQSPTDGLLPQQGSVTRSLATILQKEMDDFCRISPNFPPARNPPQPRATLLILDRSIDPMAPLLHEFTYQAMINDLLPVEPSESKNGIKYTHEYNQEDGTMATMDVILNEEDTVYRSVRHQHIAECTENLVRDFKKFLEDHKATSQAGDRQDAPRDTTKNLKDMKEMITNIPKFQDMKAKYSAHISIAQECMSRFEQQKLNSVGNLEQNMATGETPSGNTPKTIVLDMVPLLDDPHVSPVDKARLLMLYILYKDGNLYDDDKRKLLEHARLPIDLREAVNNLSLLGIKVSRDRKLKEKGRKKEKRRRDSRDAPFELSRYIPNVKRIMDSQLSNTLEASQFAYTRQSDIEHTEEANGAPHSAIPASGISLRTTKPTWNKKGGNGAGQPFGASRAKLIVVVLGGMTHSEIRSAYELAELHDRDIYVGTTEILKPSKFVENLSRLRQPIPAARPIIAPYVAPPPVQEPHKIPKISNLIPHINHTTSSLSSVSLNSPSIKSGTSGQSTPDKPEEKKKKRGLKKLFG